MARGRFDLLNIPDIALARSRPRLADSKDLPFGLDIAQRDGVVHCRKHSRKYRTCVSAGIDSYDPSNQEIKNYVIEDRKGGVIGIAELWIGEYAAGKVGLLEPGSNQIVEIDMTRLKAVYQR